METQVKTHLEGISPLSHKHLLSCRFAGEGKSVVLGIREIACPQIEFADVQIGTNVSTQDCIELLGVGIGLVPPYFTLCIHVGTEGQALDERIVDVKTIGHHSLIVYDDTIREHFYDSVCAGTKGTLLSL